MRYEITATIKCWINADKVEYPLEMVDDAIANRDFEVGSIDEIWEETEDGWNEL